MRDHSSEIHNSNLENLIEGALGSIRNRGFDLRLDGSQLDDAMGVLTDKLTQYLKGMVEGRSAGVDGKYIQLTADHNKAAIDAAIDRFVPLFLMSIQAGGG